MNPGYSSIFNRKPICYIEPTKAMLDFSTWLGKQKTKLDSSQWQNFPKIILFSFSGTETSFAEQVLEIYSSDIPDGHFPSKFAFTSCKRQQSCPGYLVQMVEHRFSVTIL